MLSAKQEARVKLFDFGVVLQVVAGITSAAFLGALWMGAPHSVYGPLGLVAFASIGIALLYAVGEGIKVAVSRLIRGKR